MSLVPFPPTFSRTWFHQLSSSWDFQSFFSYAIFPLPKICSHHSKTRRSCEIKPVNPKGNQSWTFIGGIDAEAEMPILWPPEVKSWLIGKDPNAGKDWKQEEKGMTDEMREWDGWMASLIWVWASSGRWWRIGKMACCSPWGHKELDMTEWLNNNPKTNQERTFSLSCNPLENFYSS